MKAELIGFFRCVLWGVAGYGLGYASLSIQQDVKGHAIRFAREWGIEVAAIAFGTAWIVGAFRSEKPNWFELGMGALFIVGMVWHAWPTMLLMYEYGFN